ncbi:MAG: dTMP kinase [Blastopirellula sp.]|nr:MAG: dTMP kinase [Blastopirellula sp.]
MFFAFDGLDGVGKSTQQRLFIEWLEQQGYNVKTCRDPGSTPLGEKLRDILLEKSSLEIHARTEMLLYMAARSQLVEEVIRPAQAAGQMIISDRFLLANIAYQAYGGEMSPEAVRQVGQVAVNGSMPDATFLLDMPCKLSFARLDRQLDRMESKGLEYMERVRQGFLEEAKLLENVFVLDATQDIDTIQQQIRSVAEKLLKGTSSS